MRWVAAPLVAHSWERGTRCRSVLRTSGVLPASVIALVMGYFLRNVPVTADTAWWPYALFAYAFLAAVVPWVIGCFVDGEFRPGCSLGLGIIFALPFWLAARWLADSPYRLIVLGCRAMVVLWGVHLLLSVVLWLGERRRKGSCSS